MASTAEMNVAREQKKCGYIRILKSPICYIGHETCFRNETDFKRHMMQVHGKQLDGEEIKKIICDIEAEKEKLPARDDDEMQLHKKYWRYYGTQPVGKDGLYQDEKLPVIAELKVHPAQQCTKCFKVLSNPQKHKAHQKNCQAPLREVLAQTLMNGNALRYFRVGSVNDKSGIWLLETLMEMSCEEGVSSVVPNMKELNALHSQLQFQNHLGHFGLTVEKAMKSVQWDVEKYGKGGEAVLYKLVSEYMKEAVRVNSRNVFVKTHSVLGQKIHLAISESTLTEYTKRACSLLYFVYNSMMEEVNGQVNGELVISKEQCEAMKQIEGSNVTQSEPVREDEMVNLQKLLKSLFLSSERTDVEAVPLFIACSSIMKDDEMGDASCRFGSGADISPCLAALLFLIQCIIVHEVYGGNRKLEEGENEGGICTQTRGSGNEWKVIEEVAEQKKDCGAVYVRYCMNVCNKIRDSEMAHVRFVTCQKHDRCAFLDGKELSLQQLGDAVRSQQKAMADKMGLHMLFGFESQLEDGRFWEGVRELKDNLLERKNGFWFGAHPANRSFIDKWRKKYGEHLDEVGFWNSKDNSFDLNRSKTYMREVEEVTKNFFWLLQVTSGGPARCTELEIAQIQNTEHGSRHIFIQEGRIFYVLCYHKGREKFGGIGKPIARFPDEKTSRLMIIYLLFIRPLEKVIYWKSKRQEQNEEEKAMRIERMRLQKFLFSNRSIQHDGEKLKTRFTKVMQEEVGEKWGINHYRHYHAGIVKRFVDVSGRMEENNVGEIVQSLHEQSGHGIGTAHQIYGVSEMDMRRLDSMQLEVWRRSSYKWHSMLFRTEKTDNLERERKEDVQDGMEGDGQQWRTVQLQIKTIHAKIEASQRSIAGMKAQMDEMKTLGTEILDRMKRMVQHTDESGGDRPRKRRIIEHQRTAESEQQCDRERVLKALRLSVGNRNAEFKSTYQEESLKTVCSGEGDGLFILPTGSGKSQLFMFVPFVRPGMTSVVIVPLVALQLDLVEKCRKVGINGVLWKDRHAAGVRIVFCSCEHVTRAEYADFVKEYWKNGRLFGIFVDEAHIVKQWSSFRPVLGRMAAYIRPAGCDVNVHALTATCPPRMRPVLEKMVGLRDAKVVRQAGVRRNIQYRVMHCIEEDVTYTVLNLIVSGKGKEASVVGADRNTRRIIVYCLTRRECDVLVKLLEQVTPGNVHCVKYHAGMKRTERKESSKRWMEVRDEENVTVIVATAAFGCGIDVPDVCMVVHVRKPRNILSFLQESGRAGRDGRTCQSIVINVANESIVNGELVEQKEVIDWTEKKEGEKESKIEEDRMEKSMERFSLAQQQHEHMEMYGNLSNWVHLGGGQCRRWILERYQDGIEQRKKCYERGVAICDLCEKDRNEKKSQTTMREGSRVKQENNRYVPGRKNDFGLHEADSIIILDDDEKEEEEEEKKVEGKAKREQEWEIEGGGIDEIQPAVIEQRSRTPSVMRRLDFEHETDVMQSTMSQSQTVSAVEMNELSAYFEPLCAVCSITERKEKAHVDRTGRDMQACSAYKSRCFRCASSKHRNAICFMKTFQQKDGWCHRCSLSTHANGYIHTEGSYGTKKCPLSNCLRFVTAAFESAEVRPLFNQKFPAVKDMNSNEEMLAWLRKKDHADHTWFADVMKWIKDEVLSII